MTEINATPAEAPESSKHETLKAIRNAFTLGGSLLFTWGVSIAMRLLLPRYLGPERFGTLSFVDAFTLTFFVVLELGADAYVRKEVSVRPEHASDFFGGVLVLRLLMTAALMGVMALVLHAAGRPAEVQRLVWIFAFAQLFVHINASLSAMLHAKGDVGGMSIVSMVTKIVWAGGILLAIMAGFGLPGVAASYLVSEALKACSLYWLARQHLKLELRVDTTATKAMVLSSLPFYLNTFATTAYGKLDVSLLEMQGNSHEVGWYASASTIAGLTLLATPLIGWVLMPLLARAAARSHDELYRQIRRAAELILTVVIPVSLMVCLGADLWVRIVFGAEYAPAALALRILASMFVLMYVSIIYAITLIMLGRAWTLACISAAGLVVNAALNLLIVPHAMAYFGPGGGGAGCAIAMLGTELFVNLTMLSFLGRRSFDRRSIETIVKSLGACAVAVLVHQLAAPLGWARLILDAAAYLVVVIASGALRVGELTSMATQALRRRSNMAAEEAA